jgi:signal transduction histidine kinase
VNDQSFPSDNSEQQTDRVPQDENPYQATTERNKFRKRFGRVVLRNPIERRQAAVVQITLIGLVLAALFWIPLPLSMPGLFVGRLLGVSGASLVVLFTSIAVIILRRGYFHSAVLLATTGLLLGLALVLVAWGLNTGMFMLVVFALPVALAGLLGNRRGLLFTIVLSIVIVLTIAVLEHRSPALAGVSPLEGEPTRIIVGTFVIVIALLGLFLDRFGVALRDALSAALTREAELERIQASLEARSAELSQANAELERQITERKELEARLLHSQKMESIGRLAGGLAHDFNNLLTAITGYTSMALDALPTNTPAASDLTEVQKAAQRATNLTRQLLTFARKQIIEPQVLNLNDLILEMDKLLRRLIGADIEFVTLPAADLWHIKADPGQLEQVLVNLAVNARDAMPDGGTLLIETTNILIDPEQAYQHANVGAGAYVMLTVSDTGIGMTSEVQTHLFEPFFTTKEHGKGTGLGLATCYGIVAQHSGYIWVSSELAQGTTMRVYLPRAEGTAEPRAWHDDAPGRPRGTETVLLVEDEPAVRELATRVLRAQGYRVLDAAGGAEALASIQQPGMAQPDLVLTDLIMPQLGGAALVEQLLAMYPAIKVLFMSGYTEGGVIQQGLLNPGVAFLQKPFTPTALIRKVREVLES